MTRAPNVSVHVTEFVSTKCFSNIVLSLLDMTYPYMASPPFDSGSTASTAFSFFGVLSKTTLIYFHFLVGAPSLMALNLFYVLPYMLLQTKAMLLLRGAWVVRTQTT